MTEQVLNRKYAILQEVDLDKSESWMYFILHNGNEEALAHLEKQLDSVNWEDSESGIFEMESKYLVSEQTAKDMIRVDLNPTSFHRKFDGTLQKIDFGFVPHMKNEKRIKKVCRKLEGGQIEDYLDQEELVVGDNSKGSEDSVSDSVSDSEESSDDDKKSDVKKIPIPRVAMAKQKPKK